MVNLFDTDNLTQNEQADDAGHIWAKFCASSGEKCKIIGTQDGWFPDFGHHVRLEMGGIWVHPIKLLDGFWTRINGEWLIAEKYQNLPFASKFFFQNSGLSITRTHLTPDSVKGAIIRYELRNNSTQSVVVNMETAFKFDLSPVWNSDKLGILDGADTACFQDGVITAADSQNPWHAVVTASPTFTNAEISKELLGPAEMHGNGIWARAAHEVTVAAGECAVLEYYISGSWKTSAEAMEENNALCGQYDKLSAEKAERYRRVNDRSHLVTSDLDFNKAFEWVKYNNEWLIQDSEEFGRAAVAGIPEYTWWFGCDNSYSIQGILALGDFALARDTILLLCESSERKNGNGRIVHEITTYGEISNPGNTQETAHYITAVYKYLKWTGDMETVKRVFPYCVKGIEWLLGEMDPDGDLLPSGYGIIEIAGLNVELTDTAVYTCQALYCMHELSSLMGNTNADWLKKADTLRDKINQELFLEKHGLFAEAVGTPRQLLERLPQIKSQYGKKCRETEHYFEILDQLAEELSALEPDQEIPFLVNRSWVINTPMETQLATEENAQIALKSMRTPDFVNEHGVYLSGYAQDAVMTISTGVQAVAEGRYKNADEALVLLEKMASTMGAVVPGSINEMCPNYGCFTQEWTVYGMLVPVVECFAGICADALACAATITPCIPSKWSHFSLTNVKLGDNTISLEYSKYGNTEKYYLTSEKDWALEFVAKTEQVTINGVKAGKCTTLGAGTHCIEVVL